MTESRDLTISAYLNMSDQDFKDVFSPKERTTNVGLLKEQTSEMSSKLDEEIELATEQEDYETAGALNKVKKELEEIEADIEQLEEDDVTDKRYQLEDKKRKLAQEIDVATKDKRMMLAVSKYNKTKHDCLAVIDENGNDHERKAYNDIVSQEAAFMATNSPIKIQEKTDELHTIISRINWRTPGFLLAMFDWCSGQSSKMNNQTQANSLIDSGKFAIESENWERLREIIFNLFDLLPRGAKESASSKIGF